MRTITFYSYKGGAGRTLLLANLADFLARNGLRVALLDLDFEAPGLPYKFGYSSADVRQGVVDYLVHRISGEETGPLIDYCLTPAIPKAMPQGCLYLLPAGQAPRPAYASTLARIAWQPLIYDSHQGEQPVGISVFQDLRQRIAQELHPDLLFIDSRTGLTDIGGIALGVLPDTVVMLVINNPENLEGSAEVLASIRQANKELDRPPVETVIAMARIPESDDPERERRTVAEMTDRLNAALGNAGAGDPLKVHPQDVVVLHSDPELQLMESLRVGDRLSPNQCPLLRDYLALVMKLGLIDILPQEVASVLHAIRPTPVAPDQLGSSERDLPSLRDRLGRGLGIWEAGAGATAARVRARAKRRSQGLVFLLPSHHSGDGFGHLEAFAQGLADRLNEIAQREPENASITPGSVLARPAERKVVSRITWDHIITSRLVEGDFDLCGEAIFLTRSRSQMIGVVQFGWLPTFTAVVVDEDSRNSAVKRLSAIRDSGGSAAENAQAHVLQAPSLAQTFEDLVAEQEFFNATVGVLGETAAASEAVEVLSGIVRAVRLVTFPTDLMIADWLTAREIPAKYKQFLQDGAIDETLFQSLQEAYAPGIAKRIALCDHIVARRVSEEVVRRGGRRPVYSVAHEVEKRFLRFDFRAPVPVGFPVPRSDPHWRRLVSNAFARTLVEAKDQTPWGCAAEAKSVAGELSSAGIRPFSVDELCRLLLLDMDVSEAQGWLGRFQRAGLLTA